LKELALPRVALLTNIGIHLFWCLEYTMPSEFGDNVKRVTFLRWLFAFNNNKNVGLFSCREFWRADLYFATRHENRLFVLQFIALVGRGCYTRSEKVLA
jgi:hypothetical protein